LPGQITSDYYEVVSCNECGFCYANNIPDQASLNEFYQKSGHHLHKIIPAGLSSIHSEFYSFIKNNCSLGPNAKVLDIGSSMGHFLSLFKKDGFENLTGIEPSYAAVDLAKNVYGIEVFPSTFDTFMSDSKYHLLTMCGVLEHVYDLKGCIKKIYSLTHDNGFLFVAVPDAQSFGYHPPREPFLEFAIEHINFFSAASLDNLLCNCGFEKINSNSIENDFYGNRYLIAVYKHSRMEYAGIIKDGSVKASIEKYVALSTEKQGKLCSIIEQLVESKEPLVVWGAGSLTTRLFCDTSIVNANIRYIVDRNKALQGKIMHGIKIVDPSQLMTDRDATVLIASTTYCKEIRDILVDDYKWQGRILTL
jgi:hypothetical protein